MTVVWTSRAGVPIPDLVPASLRREWVTRGLCPDRDLYSLFADHVLAHPERAAVIDGAGPVGYAELDRMARHTAAALLAEGLGPRDIVAIRLPDNRFAVTAELAVAAIGAVSLPLAVGRGLRDVVSLLGRSRARGLITGRGDGEPVPVAGLPHLLVRLAPAGDPGSAPPRPRVEVDPEAPARIMVSSGSETEPKMIAYSHNAIAGGRTSYLRALSRGVTPMRNLVLVPLASSFGSCGVAVTVAALGATLIVRERFDAGEALRCIERHHPTHVFGVPTMLRRMADLIPPGGMNSDGLRAVVSSGAALPPASERICRSRFGVAVITVYGSTDGVNCHTAKVRAGNGRPDPAVADIAILDGAGRPVPAGTEGEICALGPMTPLSYVAAPDLNERYRLLDGSVRTGDRGMLDGRGILHVSGRLRQVVIRGGRTISPAEVEALLAGHPAVADAACVAVPDPDLGERLCACVVPRTAAEAPTLPQLTEYLRAHHRLEPGKLPERLLLLPALPLGATGKVCRRTLSALAAGGEPP